MFNTYLIVSKYYPVIQRNLATLNIRLLTFPQGSLCDKIARLITTLPILFPSNTKSK